jgi:hypothetical protein
VVTPAKNGTNPKAKNAADRKWDPKDPACAKKRIQNANSS